MRLIASRWPSIVRSFAPDPVRPSGFSRIVTIAAGLANILVLGFVASAMLEGIGGITESASDDRTALLSAGACGVLIILWAGVMANIKAARWATTLLYATALALVFTREHAQRDSMQAFFAWLYALSLVAAALPLLLRKRHTQ